jgi:hypothetical protein
VSEHTILATQEPAATTEVDRRQVLRYAITLAVEFSREKNGTEERRWTLVRDVSSHGVGLVVSSPVPTDSTVRLRLPTGQTPGGIWWLARVVHCTPEPQGNFLVGCELEGRLSGSELQFLLQSEWSKR